MAVVQAGGYSSNSSPSLGTSICRGGSPKKPKKKKKKKEKREGKEIKKEKKKKKKKVYHAHGNPKKTRQVILRQSRL